LGIHFFNPVPVMPLVELIPAIQTAPEVVDRSRAFAQACGKEVTTSKDVPGFVSNRLLMPFINEAVMALEKGIASRDDIDKTLRLGMNHPMGPLTLADFIGLDTCLSIMETLYRETADSKYRPAVLLGRMVDAGWFGKKSGKVRLLTPAIASGKHIADLCFAMPGLLRLSRQVNTHSCNAKLLSIKRAKCQNVFATACRAAVKLPDQANDGRQFSLAISWVLRR
jgi:3-hydroxyacyl-CoA dehydrogenase